MPLQKYFSCKDLDLTLKTPGGSIIFAAGTTVDGGSKSADANGIGGSGFETITFPLSSVAPGTYILRVVNRTGFEVRTNGQCDARALVDTEYSFSLTATLGANDPVAVTPSTFGEVNQATGVFTTFENAEPFNAGTGDTFYSFTV